MQIIREEYLERFKRPAVMNRRDERFGAKVSWGKQEASNDVEEVSELRAKKFSKSERATKQGQ
jgi:hypothetical protein